MAGSSSDWRAAWLRGAGFPVTDDNLRFLSSWYVHESGSSLRVGPGAGSGARYFNPWNIAYTSLPQSLRSTSWVAFTSSNGTQIAGFRNATAGGLAWGTYLRSSGLYASVVRGLAGGSVYAPQLREGVLGDLSTWVSGSRSGNLSYGGSILSTGDPGKPPSGGSPSLVHGVTDLLTGGPELRIASHLPGVGGVFGAAGEVRSGIVSIADVPKWLFENWDRALEVLGGFVLLLVGLVLMGRAVGMAPKGSTVILAGAVGEAVGRREYARQGSPEPARAENLRRRPSVPASPREQDREERRARRAAAVGAGPSGDIPF